MTSLPVSGAGGVTEVARAEPSASRFVSTRRDLAPRPRWGPIRVPRLLGDMVAPAV
jgi:hypothetical protein